MSVHGHCDGRFQRVGEEFERNLVQRGDVGASVCIVVDGEPVVDLWGGVADPATGREWERDTVGLIFSSTKGAVALCAHLLADRGELDLDAPVSDYWPEFAKAGKERIPVRMLLNHQAGLPALRAFVPVGGFYDWELMTDLLAAEEPFWVPGERHGYHAITYGWLVGEVVRRVSGAATLGAFFAAEVAEPLGLDFWIGLPEEVEPRVAPSAWFDPSGYAELPAFMAAVFGDPSSVPGLVFLNTGGFFSPSEWDTRAAHAAEIPAGNGISNARGLAGMYAPLSLGGAGLVHPAAIPRMRAVGSAGFDATLRAPSRFALGFSRSTDNRRLGPEMSVIIGEGAFGHPGMGGSIGFADPERHLAFGYTMNQHGPGIGLNPRGQSLIDAAYRVLGATTDEPGCWV